MRYCQQCGSLQEPDATVCAQCGAPQAESSGGAETLAPAAQADPATPVSLAKNEAETVPPTEDTSPTKAANNEKTFTERHFPLLLGVAIVAILGMLVFIFMLLRPAPEAQWETPVFQAFADTHIALMAEFGEAADALGLMPLLNTFSKTGVTQEITLSVPYDGIGILDLHALQAKNAKGDRVYGLEDITIMGFKLSLLEYSMEGNFLAFASPALFSGVYSLSLDELAQTLPHSAIGQLSEVPADELAAFADCYDALLRFNANGYALSDEVNSALRNALHTLEGAVLCADPVEETVPFDTGELLCQVHTAQIPLDALETYLLDCADILMEEEVFSAALRYFSSMEERSDVDPIAEVRAQWDKAVNALIEGLDTVALTVYLQDGIALRTELLLRDENDKTMQFLARFSGGEHLTDRFELHLYINERALMTIYWDGTIIPRDGVAEGVFNIQLVDGAVEDGTYETVGLVNSFQWDSTQTSDNLHFDVTIFDNTSLSDDSSPQLILDGSVALDGGILFDALEFSYTDEYGVEKGATATLYLTPTQEVKSLAAHATDLLSLDADALKALAQEVESALARFGLLS